MNPIDEFVNHFKKLYPDNLIMVDYENEEGVVIYHDVSGSAHSDDCVIEHMSSKLERQGVKHWITRVDDPNKFFC